MSDSLGRNTKLTTTIGFAIWFVGTIISFVMCYDSVKARLNIAIDGGVQNNLALVEQEKVINGIRLQQALTQQKLDDFRQSYERDMERYVREPERRKSGD